MAEVYLEVFEDLSQENDITYWLASDLMRLLGYDNEATFKKVVLRAQGSCATSNVDPLENFIRIQRQDGEPDLKLTRFACFLVAMNADSRRPEVAKVQTYLAALADAVQQTLELTDNIPRVPLRGEITEREKSLASTAQNSGVFDFPRFHSAGYRGMYNMSMAKLKSLKGVPSNKSLLDFMGKTELAANLFRITQTEQRIKGNNVRGQANCEQEALHVGRKVRETMKELGGVHPEDLPTAQDINTVILLPISA